ncbi:hypothetical protein [Sorangium sp. So ce124]
MCLSFGGRLRLLTHRSIKQHRGSIRVESDPGEGTTLRMCLPGMQAERAE